ncbi:MAG: ABC transporter ATP-binding protein [Bacteroidetes bacterium]|nr:ABC transporter ATP-binding protein [Bacteroidota bacterium]MDA0902854.1 ABC transporter ATP-binding protein [Bacteroidota bacterium]
MKALRALFPLIRHQRRQVVLIGVLHAMAAVLSLFTFLSVVPFLRILFGTSTPEAAGDGVGVLGEVSLWFDLWVQAHGASKALVGLCLTMVVLALAKNAVQYAALYVMAGIRSGVSRDLRQVHYERMLSMPMAWFTESKRGDIVSRFTHDLMEVEYSVIGSLEALLKAPLMIVVSLVTLVALSWKLTLFAFLLLPLSGWLISRWAKRLKRHALKGKEELGQLVSVLEESLVGMRILKAFNAESYFATSYQVRNDAHFKAMRRMHRRESMSSPMSEVISLSVMALLLGYGGTLVLGGHAGLTGDWFIGYLVVFSQIIPPARSLSDGLFRVSKGVASLERLQALFEDAVPEDGDALHVHPQDDKVSMRRGIRFEGVTYAYPGQQEAALQGVDLDLPRGKVVALVGSSGSGKTTVAHLLSKFADPDRGSVRVDDTDLREVRGQTWRSSLAVVTQDALLFHGSIAQNIALGEASPDMERVTRVAKTAHVTEFTDLLPEGLHSPVGDGGGKLSGGQRQRVALARALYRNAEVLILDEATSALDASSESIIQQALGEAFEGMTVLVIAHRLSTIRQADLIAVMEAGRVVEQGSHDDLLSKSGRYAELFALQQGQ